MKRVCSYIRMHFKLLLSADKNVDKKSRVLTSVLGVLSIAVGLALCYLVFDVISGQFLSKFSPREFSVLLYTVLSVVLLVVGISKELKFYLNASDMQIVARFPMSPISQFVSHLIIVFIYLLAISVICTMSVMCMFGAKMGILSVGYIFRVFLSSIFTPLVPFAIATLFVVPTMYIVVSLQNRNIIKLIIFLTVIAGLFALYSVLLNFLAEYYIHQRVDAKYQDGLINIILSLTTGWNFFSYPSNIAFGEKLWVGVGVILAVFLVVLSAGILIAVPIYDKIRLQTIEGKKKIFSKTCKITGDKPFVAIFKKELKEIVRTTGYSYFYLGISLVTPVMVYLTNSLIEKVGKAQMGGSIVFGVSVLVVLAFVSMINSFAGSVISRENKQFYITKIVPVDARVMLLAKGLVNLIVSVLAIIVSLVVLCAKEYITVTEGVVVLGSALLFTVGIILNGFNINVSKPNINSGEGESQSNTMLTMFLGLLITAVEGFLGIYLSFFVDVGITFAVLLGISFVYAVINTLVFVFRTEKRYLKIEN